MPTDSNIFLPLINEIVEDVKNELRLQGHKAFGNLEQSIAIEEFNDGDSKVFDINGLEYLQELEHGVNAGDINISPSDFGKLVEWVKLRGMARKFNPRQVAYFIIQKWKREGKPLHTSLKFSQTGEILHAVEISLREWNDKYQLMFSEIVSRFLTLKIKSNVI